MKKKTAVFIITLLLVAAVAGLSLFNTYSAGRICTDKDTQITAAVVDLKNIFSETDSENVYKIKLREITDYCDENNINTAIIPYNDGKTAIGEAGVFSDYSGTPAYIKEDILYQVKRPFEKSGMQVIIQINCEGLDKNEIVMSAKQIISKYRPAGILLAGIVADADLFEDISADMKKILKRYWFGVKLDNIHAAQNIPDSTANLFVVENITENEYSQAKTTDFSDRKILIDYESKNFLSNLFILSNFSSCDGAVITEYVSPEKDLTFVNSMKTADEKTEIFEFETDTSFAVTNPAKDTVTTAEGIFVAGICDGVQPVYINGELVDTAADGTFGCYIELEEGENIIQIVQGQNNAVRTVVRKEKQDDKNIRLTHDETEKACEGQVVETFNPLTSILANPDYDSTIIDGVQKGVQLVVKDTVITERDGQYTCAYKLSNGGFILAKDVVWVEENDYTAAKVDDIATAKLENGDEKLNISVSGKPAVVSYFGTEQVIFEILNAEPDEELYNSGERNIIDTDSIFCSRCTVFARDGNVYVELDTSEQELWGYNIEYSENDTIEIYLKKPPQKSKGEKPLSGVLIVLDAGHGGTDPGALAVGGINGPHEADLNLAVAQATKNCLEKFGATVVMTRSEDDFLALQQRREITSQIKPDLFISVHHNSMSYTTDATKATGVESYYFTPQSKYAAEKMSQTLSTVTERENRGYYFGYYYVLRNDIAPSVLNEYGFVNNPYEYAVLHTNKEIYKAAIATALAVLDIIPE